MNIDWDNLSFSLTPTKYMYVENTHQGKWLNNGKFEPFGNISLSPASVVLNYGQGLFEGLKAYRNEKNEISIFRPIENIKRMNIGAKRLAIPQYDENQFMYIIEEIVKKNKEFIPPYNKGALYIRPIIFGTSQLLGVAPSKDYAFIVFSSPVGSYFKEKCKTIKLKITTDYYRATPKGTGHIKYIGNYSGGMLAIKEAKEEGLNDVIYLDAKESKYIEEASAANFFMIKENILYTPQKGSILPGITRDSILKIAKDILKMEVVEKKISYEEVLDANECFLSGTGATISPIGSIQFNDRVKVYNKANIGLMTKEIHEVLKEFQLMQREDIYGWSKKIIVD